MLVSPFLMQSSGALVLDVRSPAEYSHAHLPGAVNLPLFTDEERRMVGTAYKQQSRETAIKIGLDFFGPKMRGMVEEVESLVGSRRLAVGSNAHTKHHLSNAATAAADSLPPTANPVFIYCWRGGMRSGAVAWLLNLYGFDVTVLAGGYKAFRNWVLQTTAYPFPLRVLGGYSGSGKTALLNALRGCGQPVVDLEALAAHKGSAFGNLGMPAQPSQEMFENRLAVELATQYGLLPASTESKSEPHQPPAPIWIEDECQRLGHVNLPKVFWETLNRSPLYFLDVPFEQRLQAVVQDYGGQEKERLIDGIGRIQKRLGGLEAKNAITHLHNGDTEACFRILLQYYDKQYAKSQHARSPECPPTITIPCTAAGLPNVGRLLNIQHPLHERAH